MPLDSYNIDVVISLQISNNVKMISSVSCVTNGSEPVVSASSPVYFLADSHAFVFLLDLSHSQRTVDTITSSVLFDDVFAAFSASLRVLVRSFIVPGSDFVYSPTLYVSVLCCVPSYQPNRRKPLQVLVQGRRLISETVDEFLTDLQGQVTRLETTMYHGNDISHDKDYYWRLFVSYLHSEYTRVSHLVC